MLEIRLYLTFLLFIFFSLPALAYAATCPQVIEDYAKAVSERKINEKELSKVETKRKDAEKRRSALENDYTAQRATAILRLPKDIVEFLEQMREEEIEPKREELV